MKGLFWILALAGLAVAAALGARLNDGYLLLVIPPWRAEVSLNLFIIALLGLFLVFYAVLRVLAATFGLPKRVQEYRARRQRDQAGLVFQDAVRLLFEGRFGQAMKKATEAHGQRYSPRPLGADRGACRATHARAGKAAILAGTRQDR